MFNTPILFLIFNRPAETRRVFEEIKRIKPSYLYIAADGPRKNKNNDGILCKQTRQVVDNIDWPCHVKTLFRNENLGCKVAVSSAINWFFENVEFGIILEDDCLPDQTFFKFCEIMLEKYIDKKNIMHINGTNSQFGETFGDSSYYFSHCPQVWGWATWKRAWDKYDINMSDLDLFIKEKKTYTLFNNVKVSRFWNSLFKHIRDKKIDTWDVQWSYSVMYNSGIVITPNVNLIENIGFGADSTHTSSSQKKLKQKSTPIFKFVPNNSSVIVNQAADTCLFQKIYYRSYLQRILSVITTIFKRK